MVRRFYEILPVMRDWDDFGWYIPQCDADPEYRVFPNDWNDPKFLPFIVNFKTGWHSKVIYRDSDGKLQSIPEGVSEVSNCWSDRCYRSGCVCKGR